MPGRAVTARRVFALSMLLAWGLDVGTKAWAAAELEDRTVALLGGRLLLQESRNTGAAFGTAAGQTLALSLFAAAVVVGVLLHARRVSERLPAAGWGLVAGGAAGNLTDRLFRAPGPLRGGVVDWIDLGWFPSFNAADSALTLGVVLLLLAAAREDASARRDA